MKKCVLAVLAGILITGSSFSLAYMYDSDQTVNSLSFTGEKGLDAVLLEPSWDPQKAIKILPSAVIKKDPCVMNTSESDLDELVALQIEFLYSSSYPEESKRGRQVSEEDMEFISDVIQIDYNADIQGDWVRFEGEDSYDPVQHFYYKEVLKRNYPGKGDTTVPVFTRLMVDKDCGNEQFLCVQQMQGFDIRVSGIVLQHMKDETYFGLDCAKTAYEHGLFEFSTEDFETGEVKGAMTDESKKNLQK